MTKSLANALLARQFVAEAVLAFPLINDGKEKEAHQALCDAEELLNRAIVIITEKLRA